MSYIVVCPLENITETVTKHNANAMISLLSPGQSFYRPGIIKPDKHLKIGINDINIKMEGLISAEKNHIREIIEFARSWDQSYPLLIHCWFGVSRSPAASILSALAIHPEQDDFELAHRLRKASPSATPNKRIIEIGDMMLKRNGKLIQAVGAIGRGQQASQGRPFILTPSPL